MDLEQQGWLVLPDRRSSKPVASLGTMTGQLRQGVIGHGDTGAGSRVRAVLGRAPAVRRAGTRDEGGVLADQWIPSPPAGLDRRRVGGAGAATGRRAISP